MSISFRTFDQVTDPGGHTAELKKPRRAAVGDVIFLFHQSNNDSLTLHHPQGWTKVASAVESGRPPLQVRMFYRVVTRDDPAVYKLSPDGGLGLGTQSIYSILVYRGVKPDKPVSRFVTKHVTKDEKYVCPDVGKMHPHQMALYAVGGVTDQWSIFTDYPYDISVPTSFWGGTWSKRSYLSMHGSNIGGSLLTFDGSGDDAAKGPEIIYATKPPGKNYRETYLAMLGTVINPDDPYYIDDSPEAVDRAFAGWGVSPGLKAGKNA